MELFIALVLTLVTTAAMFAMAADFTAQRAFGWAVASWAAFFSLVWADVAYTYMITTV